jgi:hypothetical protein
MAEAHDGAGTDSGRSLEKINIIDMVRLRVIRGRQAYPGGPRLTERFGASGVAVTGRNWCVCPLLLAGKLL